MFTSDSVVLGDVAAVLKQDVNALPSFWSIIVSLTHLRAYNLILERLLARGYLLAQITSMDRGVEFERRQGLYETLVQGGATENVPDRTLVWLNVADPEKGELSTCLVFASGVIGNPQGQTGQCVSGAVATGSDLFVWPDPGDPRLGQIADY